jgi:hypothetical protein
MAVKAVAMVRKIRDKHYEQTKDLSVEDQIKFIRDKSRKLQEKLKARTSTSVK